MIMASHGLVSKCIQGHGGMHRWEQVLSAGLYRCEMRRRLVKVQFVPDCSHADTLEYLSGLRFLSYILSFCTFVDFQDLPYARFVTPYTDC